ncbi:Sensory box histidine kinase [Labilithrix luteola]|uniref:histidine kinase n=1 Tax=Labilithrix luteola TaxID=1391654 RepID=A0A0K1Q7P7_9BACT|nr:Sensory box histidine kinase [Labilithrix luteola]
MPVARKLYLVVGLMAVLVATELLTLWFVTSTMSSIRVFVDGEGRWSKAQKQAVVSILRYEQTHDEQDYQRFLEHLRVPLADRAARLEMEKPVVDRARVRELLLTGQIDYEDTSRLITFYRRFRDASYVRDAVSRWLIADDLVEEIMKEAAALRAVIRSGAADASTIERHLERIEAIDERLTELENEFANAFAMGSRDLEKMLLGFLVFLVLAVETTGIGLTASVARSLSQSLREVHRVADRVGKGDFSQKVAVESRDEVGQLARSLNQMTMNLERSFEALRLAQQEIQRAHENLELRVEQRTARLQFLATASRALASTLDYAETTAAVARFGSQYAEGWCTLEVFGEDGATELVVTGLDGELQPDAAGSVEFEPALRKIRDEALATRRAEVLTRSSGSTALCVPLHARGHLVGSLTLLPADPARRFADEEIDGAESLARMAGSAIDSARLYRSAQEAIGARDEFLSIASHELRTPLTSLLLLLQGMLRTRAPEEAAPAEVVAKLRRYAAQSERQANRLSILVDQLLDLTRIRAGRLVLAYETCDLVALVREVLQRNEVSAARAGCELVFRGPEEAVVGSWDCGRIEQVVTNLVSNALKFGAGHPVRIAVERGDGGKARLTVEDEGVGIPEDQRPRIFERFERAAPFAIGGLGLGLYIVRQIVEAHHGTIRVDSRPGEHTVFTVELPTAPNASN